MERQIDHQDNDHNRLGFTMDKIIGPINVDGETKCTKKEYGNRGIDYSFKPVLQFP